MSTQCTAPHNANLSELTPRPEIEACVEQLSSNSHSAYSLVQKWTSTLRSAIVNRYEQRLNRLAFRQMLRLDDHMLKDIGVTRADVVYASQLPLSVDAAKQVESIAKRNRTIKPVG